MSILQKEKIDFVGRDENGEQLCLAISDHLDWSNERQHIYALQEKINTYVRFIESGQVRQYYREKMPSSVGIRIYFLHEPTELTYQFLGHAKEVLSSVPAKLDFVKVDQAMLDSMEKK